ncbi:MAG: mannose-1-phosphate guanylyltransferase/mannose-6-phosphate isomerase [Pseudomonadota bacterium]
MTPITPVLLCGGSGTRLWPLSRASHPKQFARILGDESLFQAAAHRFQGNGFAPPLVVTADAFRFVAAEQLDAIGLAPGAILLEPEGRNTAPAAALAALTLVAADPNAVMLLTPADHAVADPEPFRAAAERARTAVEAGRIVTFGIAPTRPETGYGWLLPAEDDVDEAVQALDRFVEKPDAARAEDLLAEGRALWNAGLFLARADVLIDALRTHAPDVLVAAEDALADAQLDLGFTRPDPAAWTAMPDASLDRGVMEKADNLSVVRVDGPWSDLGAWDAVWQASPRDDRGVATAGPATALDCDDTLLRAETDDIELIGIGLRDVVAVAMGDAVLVADRTKGQAVRQAVDTLRDRGARQATQLPVDHRPWGWFETLILADRFQVKRIHVHPGGALSLQSHLHRAEHWIVVAGTARITLDGEVRLLSETQSVHIPLGAVHRLENPGKVPMVLIEVQTGPYLAEDDIVRYEDQYART